MLEVVEQEQQLLSAEERGQVVARADRLGDLGHDELGVGERRERHPEDAVRERPDELRGDLEREPRLPGAARAGHGDEPRPVREQRESLSELSLPPDERAPTIGQVRRVQRPQRREVARRRAGRGARRRSGP